MEKQIKTIGVLTSGGDAPGMNAAVRAVVRTGLHKGFRMIGIQRGYNGLLNGECFEMNLRSVSNIISAGGTILYTARCLEFKTKEGQDKGAAKCRELGIDALVVIGGDGSFNGAAKLACETDIKVACIPGTIDNDLNYTDYTLGFDTAVNTVLNAVNNIRDTMSSHDRACIVEVMGRSCGDIALFSAIGGGADAVVTPEKGLDLDALAAQLKQGEKLGKSSNIILLSEGVCSAQSLKEQLAAVMLEHGIEWEKKGTHEKHLSVLDFEKKERAKEVAELEQSISDGKERLSDIQIQHRKAVQETEQIRQKGEAIRQEVSELSETSDLLKEQAATLAEDKEKLLSDNEKLEKQQKKLQQDIEKMVQSKAVMERNIHAYDEDEKWQLPEPAALMSAKAYKDKKALPLVEKLKETIKALTIKCVQLAEQGKKLKEKVTRQEQQISRLTDKVMEQSDTIDRLQEKAVDLGRLERYFSREQVQSIVERSKALERAEKVNKHPKRAFEMSR